MVRKRAMTSETASTKKLRGHAMEQVFADLIGGQVNRGSQHAKKDISDINDRTHSVKSGKYWQIFLYRRSRLETNTIFQGLQIADLMIECLDVFPSDRSEYQRNKEVYKQALQIPMRKLAEFLQKEKLRRAFFDRAMFNAGEVDYLSIQSEDGNWHVFPSTDVLEFLMSCNIENSKARQPSQFSDQKVLVKIDEKNLGELELRNDSDIHYREFKFRINGHMMLFHLKQKYQNEISVLDVTGCQIFVYGGAQRTFKIKE